MSHQNNPGTPQGNFPAPSSLPLAPAPAFDLATPGEPEGYRVPATYRRPYGSVVRDKRGQGYNTAFTALMCAAVSYLVVFLAGSLSITATIPAVAAVILGIKALLQHKKAPRTMFTGRIKGMAWGGLLGGAFCLPLILVMVLLTSWFLNFAEAANCEVMHAGDDEAIARCLDNNL
ncbi:MAG: hypothetical protein Q3965_01375 [Rothia sp. (in: high G+C Gram-positive bacteria)]|nr:hypothetical protein [Rothia sp. (in: high G+C Gram-positive bacteria)]